MRIWRLEYKTCGRLALVCRNIGLYKLVWGNHRLWQRIVYVLKLRGKNAQNGAARDGTMGATNFKRLKNRQNFADVIVAPLGVWGALEFGFECVVCWYCSRFVFLLHVDASGARVVLVVAETLVSRNLVCIFRVPRVLPFLKPLNLISLST